MAKREEQAKTGYEAECEKEPVDILEEIEIEELTVDGICGETAGGRQVPDGIIGPVDIGADVNEK